MPFCKSVGGKGSIVKGHKCHAYFAGRDGKGTCDTQCQWYVKDSDCPMWVKREDWDTEKDPYREAILIGDFDKFKTKSEQEIRERCVKELERIAKELESTPFMAYMRGIHELILRFKSEDSPKPKKEVSE